MNWQAMLGATFSQPCRASWRQMGRQRRLRRAVLAVAPEYPAIAHQASIAGTVTVRLTVDPARYRHACRCPRRAPAA